mmetsp:Transcript_12957/g.40888  ORF Transcript_12957/g.40888 Transcript_12957/m.40888 type:complete len:255 (+) Transcript_12957:237-1001(+)
MARQGGCGIVGTLAGGISASRLSSALAVAVDRARKGLPFGLSIPMRLTRTTRVPLARATAGSASASSLTPLTMTTVGTTLPSLPSPTTGPFPLTTTATGPTWRCMASARPTFAIRTATTSCALTTRRASSPSPTTPSSPAPTPTALAPCPSPSPTRCALASVQRRVTCTTRMRFTTTSLPPSVRQRPTAPRRAARTGLVVASSETAPVSHRVTASCGRRTMATPNQLTRTVPERHSGCARRRSGSGPPTRQRAR